jgi:hypothetical protein
MCTKEDDENSRIDSNEKRKGEYFTAIIERK